MVEVLEVFLDGWIDVQVYVFGNWDVCFEI